MGREVGLDFPRWLVSISNLEGPLFRVYLRFQVWAPNMGLWAFFLQGLLRVHIGYIVGKQGSQGFGPIVEAHCSGFSLGFRIILCHPDVTVAYIGSGFRAWVGLGFRV